MTRRVFTIVTPIRRGHRAPLEAVLASIEQDHAANGILNLSPQTFPLIHFASFVIFDGPNEADPDDGAFLVFENSVNGNRNAYLRQLAKVDRLGDIYSHCEGYDENTTSRDKCEYRFKYLKGKVRLPQLRHVSTPYRSVAGIQDDDRVTRHLGDVVAAEPPTLLWDNLLRPAPAIREYWNWEVVKPYLVLVGALALALAVLWLLYSLPMLAADWPNFPRLGRFAPRALIAIDVAALLNFVGIPLVRAWRTTRPAFRDRVKPWLWFSVTVIVALVAAVLFVPLPWRPYVIGGLTAAALGLFAIAVAATKSRLKNERIAATRTGPADEGVVRLWHELQRGDRDLSNGHPYAPELASAGQRFVNLLPWFILLATTFTLVWLVRRTVGDVPLVVAAIVGFFLESIWLTILIGWETGSILNRQRASIIIGSTLLATIVVVSLAVLNAWTVFFWAGLIATWLGLQTPTLTAPTRHVTPPTKHERERINEVIDLEDTAVQNHMALVAHVRQSRLRMISLRIFLFTLNWLFYRSLLPDFWRGKLFGIPTVHSAQWVLLPKGRYLFFSNYDESFTTYLNDFGTQIPAGIQKIWGTCIGNPGMDNVETFKLFVRKAMFPHQVWYRAYPELTVRQIWNNEGIRTNLTDPLADEEIIVATLRRFGGSPKTVPGFTHAHT